MVVSQSVGQSSVGIVEADGIVFSSGIFFLNEPVNSTTEINDNVPTNFALEQNYPNPFNPSTTINFSLPKEQYVKLAVFNVAGKQVAEMVNRKMKAGSHSLNFNAQNLVSGQYFYKIETSGFSKVKKMLLLK